MVVDAASKTSGRPKLLGDHQQPFADHRKPPGKRVVVGGRREVVDVILWQPVTDHRQTFADLRQPPATTPKIVVVRGRRLVVAIVWPSLQIHYGAIMISTAMLSLFYAQPLLNNFTGLSQPHPFPKSDNVGSYEMQCSYVAVKYICHLLPWLRRCHTVLGDWLFHIAIDEWLKSLHSKMHSWPCSCQFETQLDDNDKGFTKEWPRRTRLRIKLAISQYLLPAKKVMRPMQSVIMYKYTFSINHLAKVQWRS